MLGLADRGRVIDLFETLMRGDIAARAERTARAVRHRRRSGGDAAPILPNSPISSRGVKVVPAVADDVSLTEAERTRGRGFAEQAVDARAVAHLADAAQGHHRGARRPAGRSPPPRWCWCASPMPPICRRLTKSIRSLGDSAARGGAGAAAAAMPATAPRAEAPRTVMPQRSETHGAPRGAPRAALAAAAPSAAPAAVSEPRAAADRRSPSRRRELRGSGRAGRRKARHSA